MGPQMVKFLAPDLKSSLLLLEATLVLTFELLSDIEV